jgi:hypothetical protein
VPDLVHIESQRAKIVRMMLDAGHRIHRRDRSGPS